MRRSLALPITLPWLAVAAAVAGCPAAAPRVEADLRVPPAAGAASTPCCFPLAPPLAESAEEAERPAQLRPLASALEAPALGAERGCAMPPCRTPGTIACGGATCRVGAEVCRSDSAIGRSTCEAAEEGLVRSCHGGVPWFAFLACDDSSDCSAGELCCAATDETSCAACRAGPCPEVEVCVRDGVCAPGARCVAVANDPIDGQCLDSFPRATGVPCGGSERCGDDRGVCCWSEASGRGRCASGAVARGFDDACANTPWTPHEAVFACSSDRHCAAGQSCCANTFMGNLASFCVRGGCLGSDGAWAWRPFCEALRDCPSWGNEKARACVHVEGLPPGAKLCLYAAEYGGL